MEKEFGVTPVEFRRVCDHAGALRHHDRMKLEAYLEKLERRILPVALSVYFPNVNEPYALKRQAFWLLNHINVAQAGFGGREYLCDPEWLLILVVDVRNASACFAWGYQLDPYIDINKINMSIMKASLTLREGTLLQGICKTMKEATRQIVSRTRHVNASPEKHGLILANDQLLAKEENK
ncbi:MAG: hypothetical protein RR553_07560 [Akkermansia sp.]